MNEECDGAKVEIPDLIKQLEAHQFQKLSAAKVKLWACHGALGNGAAPSFASLFSEAVWEAGWHQCRIFAYTESLLAQYETGPGDTEEERCYHKRANVTESKSDGDALDEIVKKIENHPNLIASWKMALKASNYDSAGAKEFIMKNDTLRPIFLNSGGGLATVGAKAGKFRKEFCNGQEVG